MPKQLPAIKEEREFELFVCDLFNYIENTTSYTNTEFQLFGIKGQSQKGLDILSAQSKTVIQCKCKGLGVGSDKIREALKIDIVKDLEKAKSLSFSLRKFIFVSTHSDDAVLQEFVTKYCQDNSLTYIVEYWGWDTLCFYAESYPFLLRKYFSQYMIEPEYVMDNILIRDEYYQIMLEIIELERVSLDIYLENKCNKHIKSNPDFVKILYKDIYFVLDGVYDDSEIDIDVADGDFAVEYGDIKLKGKVSNLVFAESYLHKRVVDKVLETKTSPNDFLVEMARFENDFLKIDFNTLAYKKKLNELKQQLIKEKKGEDNEPNCNIEVVNIEIDKTNCSWRKDENHDNVFWNTKSNKSPFPIFDFCLLNNNQSTVVLKGIKCKLKYLYSGLHGLPSPSIVKPIAKYDLCIDTNKEYSRVEMFDPIQIPSEQSVRFQLQVALGRSDSLEFEQIEGRNILKFKFEFNNGMVLDIKEVLLNTENNNEGIPIYILR